MQISKPALKRAKGIFLYSCVFKVNKFNKYGNPEIDCVNQCVWPAHPGELCGISAQLPTAPHHQPVRPHRPVLAGSASTLQFPQTYAS